MAFLFIFLEFCDVMFFGSFDIEIWYILIVLFVKSIVFGGIEEIGWRYTFQPILEEEIGFFVSTVITFILWGIWHFLYFYVDNTISEVRMLSFLFGLFINSFILAALYKKTESLWICVMTHSLINTFAQISVGGNSYISYLSKIFIVIVACLVSKNERKDRYSSQFIEQKNINWFKIWNFIFMTIYYYFTVFIIRKGVIIYGIYGK